MKRSAPQTTSTGSSTPTTTTTPCTTRAGWWPRTARAPTATPSSSPATPVAWGPRTWRRWARRRRTSAWPTSTDAWSTTVSVASSRRFATEWMIDPNRCVCISVIPQRTLCWQIKSNSAVDAAPFATDANLFCVCVCVQVFVLRVDLATP